MNSRRLVILNAVGLQKVYICSLYSSTSHEAELVILKHRFPKTYRHPTLDRTLTRQRLVQEARCLVRAARFGIAVPGVRCLDLEGGVLGLELIAGRSVREVLGGGAEGDVEDDSSDAGVDILAEEVADLQVDEAPLLEMIGRQIAKLHQNNTIHGDLTTSNMMLRPLYGDDILDAKFPYELVLIDFGLAFVSTLLEDKAVDLYVLERAFLSTHPDSLSASQSHRFAAVLQGYAAEAGQKAWTPLSKRFEEVRQRGRKRSMVG